MTFVSTLMLFVAAFILLKYSAMIRCRLTTLVCVVLFLLSSGTQGQAPVQIRILSPEGEPLANAPLTVVLAHTVLSLFTDEAGRVTLPPVATTRGTLRIQAAARGFGVYSRDLEIAPRADGRILIDGQEPSRAEVQIRLHPAGPDFVLFEPPPLSKRTFSDPVWNVWTEQPRGDRPSFKPERMQPGRTYSFVVDLSALSYEPESGTGTYSQKLSPTFRDWLLRSDRDFAELQILIIPDQRYFESPSANQRVRNVTVNLAKLRTTYRDGFTLSKAPFDALAEAQGSAAFSFTENAAVFRLQTKKGALLPEQSGTLASVAVSFWVDGRPVDELSYPACIVASGRDLCPARRTPKEGLRGVDLNDSKRTPDAAIHLVELDSSQLVGVFRCNTCGWAPSEYKTWKLGRGSQWLKNQFITTVLPTIKLAAMGPDPDDVRVNEKQLEQAGDSVYALLFRTDDGRPSEAEKSFKRLVSDSARARPRISKPPALFIRLLPNQADEFFLFPASFARVRLSPKESTFLGFTFRIQTPLELQDYSTSRKCVPDWVLLVPPQDSADDALRKAREKYKTWIDRFRLAQQRGGGVTVFEDVDKLATWLMPHEPTEVRSRILFVLSHHEKNKLYFTQSESVLLPSVIGRRFGTPSVVFLTACATADPGAFEFVREFNSRGVYTFITSSIDVDAVMAGVLMHILTDSLSAHSADESYTLDAAFFDAVQKLRVTLDDQADSQTPYGARALVFSLIGNGGVRVCTPPAQGAL